MAAHFYAIAFDQRPGFAAAGATSKEPGLMETAYAAIRGEVSGSDGMSALRAALIADGIAEEHLDEIEALYVGCLLDPSLA